MHSLDVPLDQFFRHPRAVDLLLTAVVENVQACRTPSEFTHRQTTSCVCTAPTGMALGSLKSLAVSVPDIDTRYYAALPTVSAEDEWSEQVACGD